MKILRSTFKIFLRVFYFVESFDCLHKMFSAAIFYSNFYQIKYSIYFL